jgi:o-succinylbenzoate synthase
MKINSVKFNHIRMNLVTPFETSFGRKETRDCIIVQVNVDGVKGVGECVTDSRPDYTSETYGTAWHILENFIIPSLMSNEFDSIEDAIKCIGWIRGHQMAKAGVEMALWDAIGKIEGKSVAKLLGGTREKVDVGVSIGLQASVEKLVEIAEGYISDGYQRIKIKIKPGREVAELTALRKKFPNMKIQVDANSAYTLDNSVSYLKPLDELNLLLIEQPLGDEDLWDHHHLQKYLATPICLDESITSFDHARKAVEMGATKIINIKSGRVGGLSASKKIHDYCEEHNVPVWCGGMLETGIGRAANLAIASLSNFSLPGDISATDRYYRQDITEEVFSLNNDSTIDVPNIPGLGVILDQNALENVTISKVEIR